MALSEEKKIEVYEGRYEDLKRRYALALVRGDRLGEENKNLREENLSLRIIQRAALFYCEAASEGLPAAKRDSLFEDLVQALSWRRS